MYADTAELIRLREPMNSLDKDINWYEFLRAATCLKNNKAPGLNGVPPNAFKCMDDKNLKTVYKFILISWKALKIMKNDTKVK